jgi:hypothetical protein
VERKIPDEEEYTSECCRNTMRAFNLQRRKVPSYYPNTAYVLNTAQGIRTQVVPVYAGIQHVMIFPVPGFRQDGATRLKRVFWTGTRRRTAARVSSHQLASDAAIYDSRMIPRTAPADQTVTPSISVAESPETG